VEPRELAQRWLDERHGWNKPVAPPAPTHYRSHVSQEAMASDYATALESFARQRDASPAVYDEAVHHLGPGETTRYGREEVRAWWQTLFATFAVDDFVVEHLVLQRGEGRADRVALRWRASTRHLGSGPFGTASGAPVEIMGINHVEFHRGRVLREWVLVDEIALWMQVLAS
jgi:hypothetical protein